MTDPAPNRTLRWNRLWQNPYYRMGALAVLLIFGTMHWGYGVVAASAPEGARLKLFAGACAAAGAAVLASLLLGGRYQRRIDRLAAGAKTPAIARGSDEFFQLDARVSGMARDLEERIGQLEREKIRTEAMLRHIQEGILVIGDGREVLLLNPAAARILGVSAERAQGRNMLETVRNHDLEKLTSEVFAADKAVSGQIRLFRPEPCHLQVNLAPYRLSTGERQVVLVFHDVTEIHRLENLRREFVANVSHELKTPLTSLQGFIETLIAGAWQKPDHARRFLGMMDEDAKRLSRLIHDLLDLSRIESGGGPERREAVDLDALTTRVLSGLNSPILQKKLIVEHIAARERLAVEGDPGQLEQVLVNLLENAVKFTPEGGRIRIRSSVVRPESAPAELRFEITDSGAGIPQESLSRVFERFYRVDSARSREIGGTGLGLSIVKHIVEQHGGTVGVTSPGPHLGSTFFFSLPVQA